MKLSMTYDSWHICDDTVYEDDKALPVRLVAVEVVSIHDDTTDLDERYDSDYCGEVDDSYNPRTETFLFAWYELE